MAKSATNKKVIGTILNFTLIRPAKSKGGDRYEALPDGEDRPMVIYVPQTISRANGDPVKSIDVTLEPK